MSHNSISVWSGPRNISTALMYSFAQRSDTVVYDEPLYAHFLSKTDAKTYHPGAAEVLASMENDGEKVVKMMLGEQPKPVAFFKLMTHHLVELDLGFLAKTTNILLTRDPREMLPSYAKEISKPTMRDVGYAAHLDLLEKIAELGQKPIVIDSKKILQNPRKTLAALCEVMQIPFEESMLSWQAGARPEDGVWAKYWYENVHKSTSFAEYKAKTEPFPKHLKPLLEECLPIYERLLRFDVF